MTGRFAWPRHISPILDTIANQELSDSEDEEEAPQLQPLQARQQVQSLSHSDLTRATGTCWRDRGWLGIAHQGQRSATSKGGQLCQLVATLQLDLRRQGAGHAPASNCCPVHSVRSAWLTCTLRLGICLILLTVLLRSLQGSRLQNGGKGLGRPPLRENTFADEDDEDESDDDIGDEDDESEDDDQEGAGGLPTARLHGILPGMSANALKRSSIAGHRSRGWGGSLPVNTVACACQYA